MKEDAISKTPDQWADELQLLIDGVKSNGFSFFLCCSKHIMIESESDISKDVFW